MRHVKGHVTKVTHHPAVDMIPAGVAVLFETFQMGLLVKGVVAAAAMGAIAFHYTRRH